MEGVYLLLSSSLLAVDASSPRLPLCSKKSVGGSIASGYSFDGESTNARSAGLSDRAVIVQEMTT